MLETGLEARDATVLLLRRIFHHTIQLAVVSVGAAACSETEWPSKSSGFEALSCGRDPTEGLTLAQSADYMAVREFASWDNSVRELGAVGTPCATATDIAACEAQLRSTDGLMNNIGEQLSMTRYLTITRGDEVVRADSREEAAALLAPIESPAEAVLLVQLDGYDVQCDTLELGAVRDVSDGFEVVGTRLTSSCAPIERSKFLLRVARDGRIAVLDQSVYERLRDACIGRRPAGLQPVESRSMGELADFCARIAHLEAASVIAFGRLSKELRELSAPEQLLDQARQAQRDERRHARLMSALAERFGARVSRPKVSKHQARSLFAIALENAVEGCVRETFGALLGAFQARHATDSQFRETMQTIAMDESRHAALAWNLAAWLEPQLSADQRNELRMAQHRAIAALRTDAQIAPRSVQLERLAGFPSPLQAERLLAGLEQTLWSRWLSAAA